MKQNEKRFINIFHILFMIALAAIFLWFFIAQKIYPSEQNSQDYYVSELNYDWFYIGANEERVPMTVPGKCDSEKGEAVVFERELPSDIASNHWLCFRTSRQDMRVFINGELRDSFSTKDTRPFGLASASTYLFVELKDTDSSALLTVETVSDSTYSGVMRSVLYGDKMGILLTIFSENKTIALTRWTFVGKVMSLLLKMLSRLVITFLPRSKRLLISWLQSPSAVILEPK